MPTAAAFWDLRDGDTVLEFAVKAKRGRLGNSPDPDVMRRLLTVLLSRIPSSAREKQTRLHQVRSMHVSTEAIARVGCALTAHPART